MPNTLRHERVRELLKREIGEVLRRKLSITEAGFVTVNDVSVSGNLKRAVVHLGIIGTPVQKKRALHILQRDRKDIQWLVGRSVVLKFTPVLHFVEDDSTVRGNRILKILENLEKDGLLTPESEQEEPSNEKE